jgi:hypothetical protein
VVDVRARVRLQLRPHRVDELLEGPLLLPAVVRPERPVGGASLRVEPVEPEAVLEAALLEERIAFDVEEHVAGVRLGQGAEALARLLARREQLVGHRPRRVLAGAAQEPRLPGETVEGRPADPGHPTGHPGEVRDRRHASVAKPPCLVLAEQRHLAEVIHPPPVELALGLPGADATVGDGLGCGLELLRDGPAARPPLRETGEHDVLEAGPGPAHVGPDLVERDRQPPVAGRAPGANHDRHLRRERVAGRLQGDRVAAELEDRLGRRHPGELRVLRHAPGLPGPRVAPEDEEVREADPVDALALDALALDALALDAQPRLVHDVGAAGEGLPGRCEPEPLVGVHRDLDDGGARGPQRVEVAALVRLDLGLDQGRELVAHLRLGELPERDRKTALGEVRTAHPRDEVRGGHDKAPLAELHGPDLRSVWRSPAILPQPARRPGPPSVTAPPRGGSSLPRRPGVQVPRPSLVAARCRSRTTGAGALRVGGRPAPPRGARPREGSSRLPTGRSSGLEPSPGGPRPACHKGRGSSRRATRARPRR